MSEISNKIVDSKTRIVDGAVWNQYYNDQHHSVVAAETAILAAVI